MFIFRLVFKEAADTDSKDKMKVAHESGMIEASEMTKKLILESEKNIANLKSNANKKIDEISKDLAPKIAKKVLSMSD